MLTQVLDTPITKLTMGDEINVGNDFFNGRTLSLSVGVAMQVESAHLFLLHTVLEDVLDNKAASFAKRYFMPHTSQSLVHLDHDLRRLTSPTQFEELLPNVACIAVDDGVRNAAKKLADHISLVIFRDGIKSLLNDMAAEGIHAEGNDIAMNGISNGNDLLRSAVLEAALDEKVAKAVDHERIGLVDDGLDNLELLLGGADFQLLLQKDRGLLVVVAYNLVDNVFPVTRD